MAVQQLNGAQLVAVDQQAGFPTESAATMAAIQQRESGGRYGNLADLQAALTGSLNPGSYPGLAYWPNGSPGGGPEISIGLSQINILGRNYTDPSKGDYATGQGSYIDPIKLMADPVYNAQVAYRISGGGTNFRAWSTAWTTDAQGRRIYAPPGQPAAGTSSGPATTADLAKSGGSSAVCSGCAIRMGSVGPLDGPCLLSNCQVRAITGVLAILGGGVIMLTGGVLLAAYGLKASGALNAVKAIPGVGTVATVADAVTPSGRQERAARTDESDTRAAERSARMAAAQDRQEAAERRMAQRRQTSSAGSGANRRARRPARQPLTGTF